MIQQTKLLLSEDDEVALLKNLLADPDDMISKRLLEIHYEQQKTRNEDF
jgi:putative ubiquitin-RnfH superfamily antitoxin RatB of RatAB toxin-antitoxin module